MCLCKPHSVTVPSEVQDILSHGRTHLSSTGVDIGNGITPYFWVWDGEVNGIAFSDVARQHQCPKNGKIVKCVFDICESSVRWKVDGGERTHE
jgi:hypothetical protein